jgi:hypothetical protein
MIWRLDDYKEAQSPIANNQSPQIPSGFVRARQLGSTLFWGNYLLSELPHPTQSNL